MKRIILLTIYISLCFSCSIRKSNIINFEIADNTKNIVNLKTTGIKIVNDRDTIKEKKYQFSILNKFNSIDSQISSIPTIHSFNYSNNQKVIVFFDNKEVDDKAFFNLTKQEFLKHIGFLNSSFQIKSYLYLNPIMIKSNKKYGIISKERVIYLLISLNKKNMKSFSKLKV